MRKKCNPVSAVVIGLDTVGLLSATGCNTVDPCTQGAGMKLYLKTIRKLQQNGYDVVKNVDSEVVRYVEMKSWITGKTVFVDEGGEILEQIPVRNQKSK